MEIKKVWRAHEHLWEVGGRLARFKVGWDTQNYLLLLDKCEAKPTKVSYAWNKCRSYNNLFSNYTNTNVLSKQNKL